MKTADIISCALVTLFGLVILFIVIPGWVPVEAGPGFGLSATTMPNVAIISLTALAAMFFTYRVRGGHPQDDSTYESAPPIPRRSWLFLLRSSLFLIAVTALFEWVGFLVAGPLTVAGFMIMMGERRPLPVCITAITSTVAIWLFFWQFLQFPLP